MDLNLTQVLPLEGQTSGEPYSSPVGTDWNPDSLISYLHGQDFCYPQQEGFNCAYVHSKDTTRHRDMVWKSSETSHPMIFFSKSLPQAQCQCLRVSSPRLQQARESLPS